MIRTVKQKIRMGTLFLFFLSLLSGGIGIYHLLRLKNDSKVILKDNYESLEYCHAMQQALDNLAINEAKSFVGFDSVLKLQEANITEGGEKEATNLIRKHFQQQLVGDSSLSTIKNIRSNIQKVLSLNMSAIEIKNQKANNTADKALTYISFLAAIIFLVGFTFSFPFGANIAG